MIDWSIVTTFLSAGGVIATVSLAYGRLSARADFQDKEFARFEKETKESRQDFRDAFNRRFEELKEDLARGNEALVVAHAKTELALERLRDDFQDYRVQVVKDYGPGRNGGWPKAQP